MLALLGILSLTSTVYLSDNYKVDHVQKRALRIIYPGRNYNEALSIARCSRFEDRRSTKILICL
jgi:hypothetical protein